MKTTNALLIVLVGLIVWLIFKPIEVTQQVITHTEARIEKQYDTITEYKKEVVKMYQSDVNLTNQLNILMDSLEVYKQKKDTVRIIEVQSKSIVKLQESNDTLRIIIAYKDSTINKLGQIIQAKDTIIMTDKATIKKVKRQRNGLGVIAIIEAVLLAVKK